MLPRKIFKIKGPRLAKMHFPSFSSEKLDRNESVRSLALQFGRFKKIVCWLWGGGRQLLPLPPPLATALTASIPRYNFLCNLCCNGVAKQVAGRLQRVVCPLCNLSRNNFREFQIQKCVKTLT